jgi:hypothetical protein
MPDAPAYFECVAEVCANDQCPSGGSIDDVSPVTMTGGSLPKALFFWSDDCVGEYVVEEGVKGGRLPESMLNLYRHHRRYWPA